MLASVVLYGFLCFRLPGRGEPKPLLFEVLLVVSVSIVGAIFIFRRKTVLRAEGVLATQPEDPAALGRLRMGYVAIWAFLRIHRPVRRRTTLHRLHIRTHLPVSDRRFCADVVLLAAPTRRVVLSLDVAAGKAALFQVLLVVVLSLVESDRGHDLGHNGTAEAA